jgi:hypothetical protein
MNNNSTDKIIMSFKSRNISCYTVSHKEDALRKIIELIPKGAVIGYGGSQTLEQIGILEELRKNKNIKLLDRIKVKPEDLAVLYSSMFSADVYLSGTNAITEVGQIVNVDGIGNRVAAINYGPKKVIIVVGRNKITKNIKSALDRIKKISLVRNMERLKGKGWNKENMWGQISIIERQRDPGRIHLIIVNEDLGF